MNNKFWECECCGQLIVTRANDSATHYPCPPCSLMGCEDGEFKEITIDKFKKQAGIDNE